VSIDQERGETVSVGHAELDAQHQRLLELISKCAGLSATGSHQALDQMKCLMQMSNYAQIHFRYEENVLRDSGYPLVEEHAELHTEYTRQVEKLLASAGAEDLPRKMHEFLSKWFEEHVLIEDMKYRSHLLAENAGQE
jgi:hemerythrin|tara:strand:+ start:1090 stop:1503 length:414 start_codon:yes stop_codon:yes gene_type:complete